VGKAVFVRKLVSRVSASMLQYFQHCSTLLQPVMWQLQHVSNMVIHTEQKVVNCIYVGMIQKVSGPILVNLCDF
jgi:hypothetical protein